VLRPLILIPAWSFFLIGTAEGASSHGIRFGFPRPNELMSMTAIFVMAYLLNQVFDRESDERNNKCFYLWRGVFRVRTLVLLALAFFFAASFLFRRADDASHVLIISLLALSLIYSLPPLRLCARPFVDLIANAVAYGGIAYALGYGIESETTLTAALNASPFVLLVAATFLHTAIPDIPGDEATGKISTAVRIGRGASINLAIALHMIAVVAAIVTRSTAALVVTIASFPVAGYVFLNRTPAGSSLYVQINTLVVTVTAIVLWPAYALVVAPLVLLSRFYHRRRFGITYPGRQTAA
jgi:4-hydroxybenzoate polyprenyltransferase